MKTKYGTVPSPILSDYCDSLINRIWILLPLREENCSTLSNSIARLNRELHGMIAVGRGSNKYLLTVMHLLENAATEENFDAYRSDILRCCELIKHFVADNSDGDNDV